MATYQILYWHDIPIQVRAGGRRDRVSRELPPRFQVAIDNASMAAGLTTGDDYINGLVWGEPQEREGTPTEVADVVAAELDAQYETIDWRATAVTIANSHKDNV